MNAFAVILLLVAAFYLFMYRFQRRLVFAPVLHRDHERLKAHAAQLHPFELIVHENIRLEGIVYEPESCEATLLFFGGKEQDSVGVAVKLAERYPDFRIVTFNYRGYGHSEGVPEEKNLYSDALAVYAWAHTRFGALDLLGYSLGGCVAAYVASRREVKRLFLVSSFDSVTALAQQRFKVLPKAFIRYRFETIRYISGVTAPVFMYASSDDEIVGLENSRRLRDKVQNLAQYKEFSRYNHNGLLLSAELVEEITKGLKS